MSDSENSRNNQLPPPSPPTQDVGEYTRHPMYYYGDGSVVYLCGQTLFKVYALRLAADENVNGHEFESLMKDALDRSDVTLSSPGASDSNPIILPDNVDAAKFVRFLDMVFGKIGEERYMNILTAARRPDISRPGFVSFVADAGFLAARFGMDKLDSWVQSQISMVFSPKRTLGGEHWHKETLIKLISYMQRTRITAYRHEILAYLRYIISSSLVSCTTPTDREQRSSSISAFSDLYKDQRLELSTKNPALFGYIFAVVLSLGPRSPVWADQLTREGRTILYAAYADLTRLCKHPGSETGWLPDSGQIKVICSNAACSETFNDIWKYSFAHCRALDSLVPLEDVYEIIRLPSSRQLFARDCEALGWHCKSQCAQKTLGKIDECIERVFSWLAEKHKHFVATA